MGFLSLLQLIFITLKLCGVIAWSWWVVLLPIVVSVGLAVGILCFALIGMFIALNK